MSKSKLLTAMGRAMAEKIVGGPLLEPSEFWKKLLRERYEQNDEK